MLPGQPSRTLLVPAVRLAAHQLLDTPLIFNDPIAVGLVPEASNFPARVAEATAGKGIAPGAPVDIWFQDEMRVGQKSNVPGRRDRPA
jgi:hypothetical protein